MTKLKFRVWDEKLLKFHFFNDIFNKKPFTETSSFPQYESFPLYHNCVVQQFTGLKDKNGVEIYEGDIVAFTEWGVPESWVHNYLNDGLKIVKWSLNAGGDYPFAGFTFIKYNAGDLDIGVLVDCMNIQYCKVIGNIFENKDLLK